MLPVAWSKKNLGRHSNRKQIFFLLSLTPFHYQIGKAVLFLLAISSAFKIKLAMLWKQPFPNELYEKQGIIII